MTKVNLTGNYSQLIDGIKALSNNMNVELADDGVQLNIEQVDHGPSIKVVYENGKAKIEYEKTHHFYRAFSLLIERLEKKEDDFELVENAQFKTVGPMFDLSRNAVMKVDTFKDMIRLMAMMGFDSAMLYMEDTYEVKDEPYFGYMRGRYSQAELKELDDYAYQFGIELIPCIQTLAHLEEFLKWEAVKEYKDTRGALLLESEPTYTLLENMIQSVSAPFRSKRIHIGMDEAEELGRGIFLNKNGYKDRFELMSTHLDRVVKVTESLGLEVMMWSDMFLKLASDTGDVYSKETVIPQHIIDQTPDSVQLMYWQYNATDINHYYNIIDQHKGFKRNPAFAGGIWVWNTFATNYGLSLKASEAALMACKEKGVEDVFVTLWGDDGYENNFFNALLGLQFYAEHAYAEKLDQIKLKDRVQFITGIEEEAFLALNDLDTPPGVTDDNELQTNPSKFMLWQDVLLGLFDKHVEGKDMASYYRDLSKRIDSLRNASSKYDYIFEVPVRLADVLTLKGTIGVELKQAYDANDRESLKKIAEVTLPEITKRVKTLRDAHRKQWLTMHKPFGWEVIDIRYGGSINRLDTAIERIKDFLNGEIDFIDELEQERLYFTPGVEESTALGWNSYYFRMASPNVFFHVLPIY